MRKPHPSRRQALAFGVGAIGTGLILDGEARGEAPGRWYQLTSARLILTSDGREAEARSAFERLRVFRAILARLLSNPDDGRPERPLSVYLMSRPQDLTTVARRSLGSVVGFYYAGQVESAAVINSKLVKSETLSGSRMRRDADLGLSEEEVLFHEYAHHFMFQTAAGDYPAWFIEGFAEYVMTAEISEAGVIIGNSNANRQDTLQFLTLMPIRRALSMNFNTGNEEAVAAFYAISWLLTHWVYSSQQRMGALPSYLAAFRRGDDPVTSFEKIFGVSTDGMEYRLLTEARQGLKGYRLALPPPAGDPPTARRLPRAMDDLVALRAAIRRDWEETDPEQELLQRIRSEAGAARSSPEVVRTLAEAEIAHGDPQTALALIGPLSAADPNDIENVVLLGLARLRIAQSSKKLDDLLFARSTFARAYAAEPNDVRTLMGLAATYAEVPGPPHPNLIAALESAYALAPQVERNALLLSQTYIRVGQFEDAIWILTPRGNNPHNPEASKVARNLLEVAKQGLAEAKALQTRK